MTRIAVLMLIAAPLAACVPSPPPGQAAARPAELRVLRWTGTAEVYPPGRTLKLGVETMVTPFTGAQSDTWILEQGRASLRSLVIDPRGGWTVRGGERTPMPEAMLRHERQQYAIYAQMQQALLRTRDGAPPGGRLVIPGDGANSVDTEFLLAPDGRLVEARNMVDDPETPGARIAQVFRFSGEIVSNGLRWPRRIAIAHGDAPYFLLEIAIFQAL